jgi:putative endonuclease
MAPADRPPAAAPKKPEPLSGGSGLPARRIAFRFGLSAESRAAAYLIAKGHRILSRRFRTPVGEIDIVARRRGVLVFVEVKARESFDAAAEAIGPRQRGRIVAAARSWRVIPGRRAAANPEFAVTGSACRRARRSASAWHRSS